jgi:hypothetical protein
MWSSLRALWHQAHQAHQAQEPAEAPPDLPMVHQPSVGPVPAVQVAGLYDTVVSPPPGPPPGAPAPSGPPPAGPHTPSA